MLDTFETNIELVAAFRYAEICTGHPFTPNKQLKVQDTS